MSDSRAYMEEPIGSSQRPTILYRFHATTGTNTPFPWDMLRFDRCWPSDGEDLSVVRRNVKLMSYNQPTPARWASCGWTISAHPL